MLTSLSCRVKVLLQTQDGNRQVLLSGKRYTGIIDCVRRVIREQGFLSLWRGNGADMMRHVPTSQLNFAFRDLYRDLLGKYDKQNEFYKFFGANLLAGAGAGATALSITYPLDFAHTRLAADVGYGTAGRQFSGVKNVISTIYRSDGLRGLYKGFGASIQGIIVHRALYFGMYDSFKDIYIDENEPGALYRKWGIAQAVSTTSGLVAYPFNTVRHRMMMQSGDLDAMYKSTLDCWRTIFRVEGVRGFYKGALSGVMRSTGAAMVLVLYDEFKKRFH